MKHFIRFVAVLAFLAIAATSQATVYYPTVTPFPDNDVSMAPGFEITFPATFTSSDSAYIYLPQSKVWCPANQGDGTYTLSLWYGMNITAAADSVAMTIGVGNTTNGGFTNIFSTALQSLTLTGTTNWVQKNDVALTNWPPNNLMRFAMKGKGQSLAYKTMWVRFPRIGVPPMGR